ncbi:hypothetical protein DENSPDRAFT_933480 [Dentipellis sp. KUC8613]|nr:hypothetical protein DENSPDRAFT_933480 [Dentipellis sp. KUC8613]
MAMNGPVRASGLWGFPFTKDSSLWDTDPLNSQDAVPMESIIPLAPSFISRLPPELLLEIFHYCRIQVTEWSSCAPEWIAITHVCQQWREIAIRDRRMWCHTPFKLSLPWRGHFVSRSAPRPMEVEYEMRPPDPGSSSSLASIQHAAQKGYIYWMDKWMDRVRRLHIRGRPCAMREDLQLLLRATPSAAILEELCLEFMESWDQFPAETQPLPAAGIFLDHIFSGRTPKLHTLRLIGGFSSVASASAPVLPMLRHFSYTDTMGVYLEVFIRVLQKLPQLETLHFEYLAPTTTTWPFPDISADLPHLSSISITSSHDTYLCQVGNHINFPATTRVHIRFVAQEPLTAQSWTRTSVALQLFYPNFASGLPTRVHIETDLGKCLLACWYGPLAPAASDASAPFHATANIVFELDCSQKMSVGEPRLFPELYPPLFSFLKLTGTPCLSISERCTSSVWQMDWAKMFCRLTDVRELRVSGWIHSPLNAACSARARAAPPPADGQTSTVACPQPPLPKLKKLIVADTVLSDDIDGDVWALEQYLMYRWDQGAALEEVVFENCSGGFDARHLHRDA